MTSTWIEMPQVESAVYTIEGTYKAIIEARVLYGEEDRYHKAVLMEADSAAEYVREMVIERFKAKRALG